MFIPTTAQQFDTKVYNHRLSLLNVSDVFLTSSGRFSKKTELPKYDRKKVQKI